ncbi:hypothetical protein G6F31_015038 [Rhizopus arrhizus]|nr:hypothetical protein G6F32_015892 [Rhizopus arrhizus]KAG0941235.1 hypothetical protein G6F31_015038 [Rhizopus arrhizus]
MLGPVHRVRQARRPPARRAFGVAGAAGGVAGGGAGGGGACRCGAARSEDPGGGAAGGAGIQCDPDVAGNDGAQAPAQGDLRHPDQHGTGGGRAVGDAAAA